MTKKVTVYFPHLAVPGVNSRRSPFFPNRRRGRCVNSWVILYWQFKSYWHTRSERIHGRGMRILAFTFLFLLGQNAQALMAPWYEFANLAEATLGRDSCVKPQELTEVGKNQYLLKVLVCDEEKAQSLHAILPTTKGSVLVQVEGPDGVVASSKKPTSPEEVVDLLKTAFKGNAYFSTANTFQGFFGKNVWLEFQSKVVSYRTDNISDKYLSTHKTAQDAFSEVLNLEGLKPVRVQLTTRVGW